MASEQKELLLIDETNKKSFTLTVSPEEFDRANTEPGYSEVLLVEYIKKGHPVRMESIEVYKNPIDNENIPCNQQTSRFPELQCPEIQDEPVDVSCKKDIAVNQKKSEDLTQHNWTPDETFLLIDCYEKEGIRLLTRKKDISAGLVKCVNKFNTILLDKYGRTIHSSKCHSKIDLLKRLYREKLDLVNVSGGQPSKWPYFEVMHNLFHKERWVKPLSTAGSGLPSTIDVEVATQRPKQPKPLNSFLEEMAIHRRLKQEADALKHREKMAQLDRFNGSMESVAQSLSFIAAAKKAKLDRDN